MFAASRREINAEFLGTFVLMIFGLGVNAQATLGDKQFGDWLSINIGWGLAVTLAVYVAGGISGAHINPAVTLAMAVRRRLPWNKVAPYILAQLAGAFVASAVVFFVYYEALHGLADADAYSMETAGIFATYPREFANGETLSLLGGLVDQIVGTALLLLCIFAVSDTKNVAPQSNLGPFVVGAIVLLIGMTFGYNAGYAINPARDFSPRLFTLFAGWGWDVFRVQDGLWWLVPIVGPCVGAVLGSFVYTLFIEGLHPADELPPPEEA